MEYNVLRSDKTILSTIAHNSISDVYKLMMNSVISQYNTKDLLVLDTFKSKYGSYLIGKFGVMKYDNIIYFGQFTCSEDINEAKFMVLEKFTITSSTTTNDISIKSNNSSIDIDKLRNIVELNDKQIQELKEG